MTEHGAPAPGQRHFNTLLSFAIYAKDDIREVISELGDDANVMADSGAYTARTQGVIIDPHDYAKWLHKWADIFQVYPNLDVLHDVPTSIRNQKAIESHDLWPCPVFHTGEPFRVLEKYCERHTYVMLGGMVGQAGAVMKWIEQCFRIADRYGTRFHGFGQTKWEALRAFPFFSCDSTSWASGHWYGQVQAWDARNARLTRCAVGDWPSVRKVATQLKRYGVEPEWIANRSMYDSTHAIRTAACAWYDAETFLRRMHGPISPPEGYDLDPGLHLHLVSGQPRDLPRAREAIRAYLSGTDYVPPVTGMALKEKKARGLA